MLCLISSFSMSGNASSTLEASKRAKPVGFFYGLALGLNKEIYKGVDNQVIAFPLIGYRGKNLNVFGPFMNYRLGEFGHFEFSAQSKLQLNGFDESDSEFFKGMADRRSSLDIGLGLSYKKDHFKTDLSLMRDVLDRSNGSELSVKFSKTYYAGPIFIAPSLGLKFLDSNYVDYYYGVGASEVSVNRSMYQGDAAINTILGLSIATPIFFSGFTRISLENTWYDSTINNSPLVDTGSSFRILLTFSKFFDS
jgi:outer membrane protein